MKKLLIAAVAFAMVTTAVRAQDTSPIQLSLTPDIALKSRDTYIKGLSLGIWNENPQTGVALGIVNGSTGESKGFSYAFFGLNYNENYHGVNFGLVNFNKEEFVGWQHGVVNISKGTFSGFQSGLVNVSTEFEGLQLGVVNYTQSMNGVQLGLANIIVDNGWFNEFPDKLAKGMVFLNWSF